MNYKYISYIKYAFYIVIFVGILIWRFGKSSEKNLVDNNTNTTKETIKKENFCDENKIKDFKNNLTKSPNSLSKKNIEKMNQSAQVYLEQYCAIDAELCGELLEKYHELYNTTEENIQLALSVYAIKERTIEDPKGGNIKIISILDKGNMVQYFILDDLRGEILVELAGYEGKLEHFAIWGTAFPYFHEQYGKFKINHNKGLFSIDYECTIE